MAAAATPLPQTRKVLLAMAAYGVVQVLAQDLGVRTGAAHAAVVSSPLTLPLLMFATAYFVTDDLLFALPPVVAYFLLARLRPRAPPKEDGGEEGVKNQ